MYFTFKPGWLKFGESGCLKDKTSKSGTDLRRPHSVKLRSHQNGKRKLFRDISLKTQLWVKGTYLPLGLKLRHSKYLTCLLFLNV